MQMKLQKCMKQKWEIMENKIIIYTDGACKFNPGPGGWAAIINYNENIKGIKGSEKITTNNIMELSSVIYALEYISKEYKDILNNIEIEIYSDSNYVVNSVNNKWIYNWEKDNWKKKGEYIKNHELWEKLSLFLKKLKISFIKVKGHSDVKYNNLCDKYASNEAENIKNILLKEAIEKKLITDESQFKEYIQNVSKDELEDEKDDLNELSEKDSNTIFNLIKKVDELTKENLKLKEKIKELEEKK